jgi:hypothetical protein
MVGYATGVERLMKRLFDSLKESDRRRYAAIEAAKLVHGGVEWERSIAVGSRGDSRGGRKCLPLKKIPSSRLVI